MTPNCLVIVHHSTGHGVVATPLVLTSDWKIVAEAIRGAEKRDYRFLADETGFTVHCVATWSPHHSCEQTRGFSRIRIGGKWVDEWLDERMQIKLQPFLPSLSGESVKPSGGSLFGSWTI